MPRQQQMRAPSAIEIVGSRAHAGVNPVAYVWIGGELSRDERQGAKSQNPASISIDR
jgi:hypothetical protein